MNTPTRSRLLWPCLATALMSLPLAASAQPATPAELAAAYARQAGQAASPERGQKFFTTNFGRDFGWSCSSCHGAPPTRDGRDQVSDKRIAPFAPAFNDKRFTDRAKVENHFRQNCKDVVGRECTPLEKADVLAWVLTLK